MSKPAQTKKTSPKTEQKAMLQSSTIDFQNHNNPTKRFHNNRSAKWKKQQANKQEVTQMPPKGKKIKRTHPNARKQEKRCTRKGIYALKENAAFSVSRTSFSQPVERVPYEMPPGKEKDRPEERKLGCKREQQNSRKDHSRRSSENSSKQSGTLSRRSPPA